MWRGFRDWHLRTKLSIISLFTTGAAMVFAGAAILGVEAVSGWREAVQHHKLVAQTLASNVRSAVLFDDRNFANQSLQVLVIQSSVRAAVLYRENGTTFAEYYAAEKERSNPPPRSAPDQSFRFDETLLVVEPIELDGEKLGVLALRSDMAGYYSRLKWFGAVLLFALLGSGIVVYPLWSKLQRIISVPINDLVGVVREVARHNNYALRATEEGRDELGELVSGVNKMLEQIEARDAKLASYSRGLEEQVRERTLDLEREVGERRRAEQQLIRFKTTLDLTLDGVFMFDPDSLEIFYANQGAAERTGYGVEMLQQNAFSLLTPEYDAQRLQTLVKDLIGSGAGGPEGETQPWRTFETSIRRGIGSEFPAEIFLQYVVIPGGEERCVAILRDVTEQRAAAQALHEAKEAAESANRAKSLFLANMSHEIRTPMNAVLGFTRFALTAKPEPRMQELLNNILISSTTLLSIIDDILDFSKIEADKMTLERVPFDILRLVEELLAMLELRARQQKIEFLAALEPELPATLLGDPVRLRQVLVNLVGNAIKFTEEGEVVLRVAREESSDGRLWIRFSVRDTGIGMTEKQAEQLFQAFSQADVSHTRRYGGTGLGLAISQRLVTMMEGQISVESRAGVGSCFQFIIPLDIAPTEAEHEPSLAPLPLERLHGLRVLVVDDNQSARAILEEALCAFGMRVETVSSGSEALGWLMGESERSGRAAADVVLVDEAMPEIDGRETIRMIRTQPRHVNLPLVLMSDPLAMGGDEWEPSLVRLGKPFTWHSLGEALLRAVDPALFQQFSQGQNNMEQQDPNTNPGNNIAGARVLVAEDIPINQMVARGMLEPFGVVVEIAANGVEAVERVSNEPFDLVLMDVQMPEMDGFQATRQIRSDPRFKDLPILAMTAGAMAEERQTCFESGMNDFISKPIDPALLAQSLQRWIKAPQRGAGAPIQSPKSTDGLPEELAGIDLQEGLQRLGGNRRFYHDMLIQFRDDQADYLQRILESIAEKELEKARQLLHAMKGIAGNVSAKELHRAAEGLEQAIKAGDLTDISIETFRTAFETTMKALAQLG